MTIHRFRAILAVAGVLALLSGCSRKMVHGEAQDSARVVRLGEASYGAPMVANRAGEKAPGASAGMRQFTQDYDESKPAAPETTQETFKAMADSQPDRYLIKNATLTVEAEDVRNATAALVKAVQAAKGYVSDMHEQSDGIGGLSATMQVRVPYTAFDQSMQQLSGLGKVLDKQVTAEDVTEEFVDTQAKVRNLKRTEIRLLDHLGRTGKLSDTLLIEKELNRVRQEVEQLEGRVRFLSHRIAFSSISVTLQQKAKVQALMPAESYSPAKEGSEAVRSLVEFGRGLLSIVIWVAVWIPVWLPIGYVAWRLIRASLRRSRELHAARFPPVYPVTPSTPPS
jgi:hypothetical protein